MTQSNVLGAISPRQAAATDPGLKATGRKLAEILLLSEHISLAFMLISSVPEPKVCTIPQGDQENQGNKGNLGYQGYQSNQGNQGFQDDQGNEDNKGNQDKL